MSECSQLHSQVQETWSDEIITVPNGDACLNAEGQKVLSESELLSYIEIQNSSFVLNPCTMDNDGECTTVPDP